MSTLTKPRAKKPSRKAAPSTRTAKAKAAPPLRNLPKGAIKLTERDFAAQALFEDDLPG